MRKLPEFDGWTVDLRLGEFRKVVRDPEPRIEFVPMRTYEGMVLWARWMCHRQGGTCGRCDQ